MCSTLPKMLPGGWLAPTGPSSLSPGERCLLPAHPSALSTRIFLGPNTSMVPHPSPPALGAAKPSTQPQSWGSLGAQISAPHLPALRCNDAEQNGNGEYRGGKLHLICFKSTEALIFWDVFLLYIFVNAKCSRCQIRLICKWKPILPSPPYSS